MDITQISGQQCPGPQRFNIYAGIHKALRACLTHTMLSVGRLDASTNSDVARKAEEISELLQFCLAHARHENDHIHPAVETAAPGSSAPMAGEHEDQIEAMSNIQSALRAVSAAGPEGRTELAYDLYRQMSVFAAENLIHMEMEEAVLNPILWQACTDAQLRELQARILATLSPAEQMRSMHWMLPAMTPAERIATLESAREVAPAAAFQAVLRLARAKLEPADWAHLASRLQIAELGEVTSA